jgi:hypothetical protein
MSDYAGTRNQSGHSLDRDDGLGRDAMPLWQRLLITLATMLLTSFVAGFLWRGVFNAEIPSYLSGVVGGVTAIPIWEFLKRVGPSRKI